MPAFGSRHRGDAFSLQHPDKKFAAERFAPPMRASLAANFKNFPASREIARTDTLDRIDTQRRLRRGCDDDRARDVDRRVASDAARDGMPKILCAACAEEAHGGGRDAGDDACRYRDACGLRVMPSQRRRAARCAMQREMWRAPLRRRRMHRHSPSSLSRRVRVAARVDRVTRKAAQDKGFLQHGRGRWRCAMARRRARICACRRGGCRRF